MPKQEFVLCVQCTDEVSGQTGDFVSETTTPPFRAVSPLFRSLVELYPWMKQNGYKLEEYQGDKFTPGRVVKA